MLVWLVGGWELRFCGRDPQHDRGLGAGSRAERNARPDHEGRAGGVQGEGGRGQGLSGGREADHGCRPEAEPEEEQFIGVNRGILPSLEASPDPAHRLMTEGKPDRSPCHHRRA